MKKYKSIFLIIFFVSSIIFSQSYPTNLSGISVQDNIPIKIFIENGIIKKIDTLSSVVYSTVMFLLSFVTSYFAIADLLN